MDDYLLVDLLIDYGAYDGLRDGQRDAQWSDDEPRGCDRRTGVQEVQSHALCSSYLS